ncbi:MAG: SgcJ/EcaC family oxidoreductase [Bacteroidetes bacterium]|nr:SgcJ/EcaC family oxidoreductase [Bacteroidota bacterium]
MKSSFLSKFIFMFCFFSTLNLAAQNDNQASFEAFLKKVYSALDSDKPSSITQFYTEKASEIDPDGKLTIGRKALEDSWVQLQGMMDAKPQFTYKLSSWRLIKPDVALITWDSHDKFFIFGQTIEGENTGSAVLHKEKGNWLIEFDQLTPKRPFPDAKTDELAINELIQEAYAGFRAYDAPGFAACFTDATSFVGPIGMGLNGRKQVEQGHAELFKAWAGRPQPNPAMSNLDIKFLSPEVAIGRWENKEDETVDGKQVTSETAFLAAFQRVNDKWQIAALSLTPVQPLPQMAGN